jgi:hypothetical protein
MRLRRRFEPLGRVNELRCCLRLTAGAGLLDKPSIRLLRPGRVGTAQSTPESGARAGNDDSKRRLGTKTHAAVDTLGPLLALRVTPANARVRTMRRRWRQPSRGQRAKPSTWVAVSFLAATSIDWHFTTSDARIKLKRLYPVIQA